MKDNVYIKNWAKMINESDMDNIKSSIQENPDNLKPGASQTEEHFIVVFDNEIKTNGLPDMYNAADLYLLHHKTDTIEDAREENIRNMEIDPEDSGRICKVTYKIEVVE